MKEGPPRPPLLAPVFFFSYSTFYYAKNKLIHSIPFVCLFFSSGSSGVVEVMVISASARLPVLSEMCCGGGEKSASIASVCTIVQSVSQYKCLKSSSSSPGREAHTLNIRLLLQYMTAEYCLPIIHLNHTITLKKGEEQVGR